MAINIIKVVSTTNVIRLSPSAVARVLGLMALILVVISFGAQLVKYLFGPVHGLNQFIRLFDVDAEQNIPTVFSVLILFCAALLLAIITTLKKQQNDRDATKWAILAYGFLLMAVDEAASIHEEISWPLHHLLGHKPYGIFFYAWVIPGIAFVCIFALFFLRFLGRLPARTRFTFVLAATIFLGGAIGLELVGGYITELYGHENLVYNTETSIEEGCEMAGVIIFIYGIMKYIEDNYKEVQFRFIDSDRNLRSKSS
jgi:hypothetical protein